jgi:uncharacterized protein YbbC (DUF1343 family)
MKLIYLFISIVLLQSCKSQTVKQTVNNNIQTGATQTQLYLPELRGKSVALVVNHTSTIGNTHLADSLIALGIRVKTIFAPEHGFRGTADAGEHVSNGKDSKTGLPIISLYGQNRKPTAQQLANIDVVVFDIQDVGARFYTYISTLLYVMEACAENQKTCLVLDRPNPNGHYVDGPVLDTKYKSFVGIVPIPIVHGCTIGELAQMFNGEGWLAKQQKCNLKIITCQHYTHQTPYSPPIAPSPNLPNIQAMLLYPSICLFEPTDISVGRGTDQQFQVIGGPSSNYGKYSFTPVDKPGAMNPVNEGKICYGYDLRQVDAYKMKLSLHYLLELYAKSPQKDIFFASASFFDKLAGTDLLRKQIVAGMSENDIRQTWQEDLNKYKKMREKYLLY